MSANLLFQKTLTKSMEWVRGVMDELGTQDEHKGLKALRVGLHTIRDRLPPVEALQLAAQLPMLLRGLYLEGWRPVEHAPRLHSKDELLGKVKAGLADATLDPEQVMRAVITVVTWHVSAGELDDVARTAARPLAELWADYGR
jgi:uncharacterized protein (DUF2267 family)